MLSPDLQRLERIRDYCNEIEKTVARYGDCFETFNADGDYQKSIAFSILQIGELGGGLSQEYRQKTASRIQWGLIKGMRNLVAHSYGNVDRIILWETAVTDIPVLKIFCEEQLSQSHEQHSTTKTTMEPTME